jgi:hypothetical protein
MVHIASGMPDGTSQQNPNQPRISSPDALPPTARKTHWLLYGCGTFIALLLLIVATVAITIWWIQRPIKPVVLSVQEKAAVDQKLQHISGEKAPAATRNLRGKAGAPSPGTAADLAENPGQDRAYTPGSKVLKLTEREINGLLNANTDLGQAVRLEFAQDAINAYVAVRIPQDFPVGGGKMFRARGRFRVSLGNDAAPYAILEDVTVFGLSLPKAWLGGLKGGNLIGQAIGERNGKPILQGIKSLHVEPGALVLEVED